MIRSALPTGKVQIVTPGTIIRATAALTPPSQHVACYGIMFQVLPENFGRIYIGGATMNRVARTGLFAMLPAPSSGTPTATLPNFSAAITNAPNALGVEEFFIDADIAGDGVIITVLIL